MRLPYPARRRASRTLLSRDRQRRAHAARAVVADRAPERVATGVEPERDRRVLLREDLARRVRPRPAGVAADGEIVRILAEVHELDDRAPLLELRARED